MYLAARDLGDGRSLYVYELVFNKARLSIGPTGKPGFDNSW
jgi:hypothetical protein